MQIDYCNTTEKMKIVLILSALLTLVGCSSGSKYFTGRIVKMYYAEEHMCHSEDYKRLTFDIVVVHTPHHTHHHRLQNEEFSVWVANSEEVKRFSVSEKFFDSHKPGDKVTIKL